MDKTKEELNTQETELHELSEEESMMVTGASRNRTVVYCKNCGATITEIFNDHEVPVDVPGGPCYRCGSRDFGIKRG